MAFSKDANTAARPKAGSQPSAKALGIVTDKPKHPEYAIMTKRLESFETWPRSNPMRPQYLAEAGLVYTGKCMQCSMLTLTFSVVSSNTF